MVMVECLTCGGKLAAAKMKFCYNLPYVEGRKEYHCCGHCRDGNPNRKHGYNCELRNRGRASDRSRDIYIIVDRESSKRSPSLDGKLDIPAKRRRAP